MCPHCHAVKTEPWGITTLCPDMRGTPATPPPSPQEFHFSASPNQVYSCLFHLTMSCTVPRCSFPEPHPYPLLQCPLSIRVGGLQGGSSMTHGDGCHSGHGLTFLCLPFASVITVTSLPSHNRTAGAVVAISASQSQPTKRKTF